MSERPAILVVDDERNSREGLARALRGEYEVMLAESGPRALEIFDARPADLVISDIRMPGMDGFTLLKRLLAHSPQPAVILLTAYGSVADAVEAMKQGARDYLTKPLNLDEVELRVREALRTRRIERENRSLREQLDVRYGFEHIIGRSAAMQEVLESVRQVAASRATVLIQGESGTGKELIAHALHQLSPRARGPFVAVHCAALSQNLLESELFGHERGAFTGATERRRGRFELADGGTLFLDEVSEIDPAIQVKILRVLEERQLERVGGQETLDLDVRLVAATNRDLRRMVEEGTFREDLFYRLYVVVIHLPALRERPGDIPALLQHFIALYAAENGKTVEGLTPETLDTLTAYPWPGNVRELRNVAERMVVMARGPRLGLRDLPSALREGAARPAGSAPAGGDRTLEDLERQAIARALRACGGNRTRAAAQLGISRRTLHRKLKAQPIEAGPAPESAGTPTRPPEPPPAP